MNKQLLILAVFGALSNAAVAGACDYTPSKLVGGSTAGAVGGAAGATAGAGIGLQAAGVYTIVNGTTGAVMLGSTAAGTSAAGTVGIIGGTAGVIGTVGTFLLSPFVIVPAAVIAVGGGAYEASCYFARRR